MANTYTCTTATGSITGLSTEVSGNIKINYTLGSSSVGDVDGNSADGTYESVVAFDAGLVLNGYTGVINVNSVNGLSGKTQQTQKRLLTHTDAKLGDDFILSSILPENLTVTNIIDNSFDIEINAGIPANDNTNAQIAYEVNDNSQIYKLDATISCNSGEIFFSAINSGNGSNGFSEEVYNKTIVNGESFDISLIIYTRTNYQNGFRFIFTNPNISLSGTASVIYTLRPISTENKYYIGTDGGAMVDQDDETYGADGFESHGSFDTPEDYAQFITSGYGWSYDTTNNQVIRVDTTALESHFYYGVNLVDGGTYEISCDSNFVSGSAQFWKASGTTGHNIDTPYQFVADTTFLNIGITTTDGDFTFDNLLIRQIVPGPGVPPLPDPNTTINLGNVAVIGYNDLITERLADFNVHSEVITP